MFRANSVDHSLTKVSILMAKVVFERSRSVSRSLLWTRYKTKTLRGSSRRIPLDVSKLEIVWESSERGNNEDVVESVTEHFNYFMEVETSFKCPRKLPRFKILLVLYNSYLRRCCEQVTSIVTRGSCGIELSEGC